ncbi:hypothetical protein BSL78_19945 [Apostichopus japonicus]|uniref:Transposase element L1Md-A101/L1Md-A102/L1Md-A2 n=1 Tax=Stichopus japonicus TaxID=307972 RepID=A0A2G8K5H2_STIJA|nr:hypothetical protein BSL78_19945 [Apostichopus japonicus]
MVRGRPKGSSGKKKTSPDKAQRTLHSLSSTLTGASLIPPIDECGTSDEDVASTPPSFSKSLDIAIEQIETISKELKKIRHDFGQAIEAQSQVIEELKAENITLNEKCAILDSRIASLEETQHKHADFLNKQERFSRRSNVRIVGYKTVEKENCLTIASEVLQKAGVPNCHIERAHRDGKIVRGRDRHILVRVSFFQDKIKILKNARQALAEDPFYITDDLTKADLAEKRKWTKESGRSIPDRS